MLLALNYMVRVLVRGGRRKLTQSIMFDAGPMSSHWVDSPVGAGISPFLEKATCAGWVGSGTIGLAICGGSVGRPRQ